MILDDRPVIDQLTAPATPARAIEHYAQEVDDALGGTGNLFAEVAELLRDSALIDTGRLHDDEIPRILDEVLDEVQRAVELLDKYADSDALRDDLNRLRDRYVEDLEGVA